MGERKVTILLGLIGCYTIFIWLYCWVNKSNVSTMTGMTITMVHAMSSSLLVGTLLGIELTGSFFLSTALSILLGLLIGLMSGITFGLLAVADGMLSGVMGGMMGAMTGIMTEPKFSHTLIQLLFLIYFIACLIVFLLNKSSNASFRKIYWAFLLTVLLSFTSFALGGQQHDKVKSSSIQEIKIEASEFAFTPSKFNLTADKKVRITVENTGKLEHRFKLFSSEHKNHPMIVTVPPGESESIILTPRAMSEYHFICSMPGHEEKGMHGMIDVS